MFIIKNTLISHTKELLNCTAKQNILFNCVYWVHNNNERIETVDIHNE